MRIAYVCLDPGVPVFGNKGSSIHCQEVMRAFQNRGCEIELFAARAGGEAPLDLSDISVHPIGDGLPADAAAREKALMDLNAKVEKSLCDSGPFDLVYERFSLWSFSAMQFADRHGVPGILEVNSPLIEEQKAYRTLIDEASASCLRNECYQSADSIVAVSEEVAARVRQNEFAKNKTTTIFNGVNCETFRATEIRNGSDQVVIGFVGTLKPWHGVSVLLEAFALVHAQDQKARLRIVGSGPEQENLQDQLSTLPLAVQESVEWLGSVKHDEMANVLATFDIAVAPYPELPDFYFSPLKVLEYMASGRAIVASRIGQIADLIDDGHSGSLVTPGCCIELAAAILEFSNDSKLKNRCGSAAQKIASSQHSWATVVDKILATTDLELHREPV